MRVRIFETEERVARALASRIAALLAAQPTV